ncbi:Myosin-binding protein [Melia azedarach]|uniref:Myosin-binding protein n=1 Tax=Melia azedarach TaxID=155640 RepID=A0ACC1XDH0_MELAZ|nr:Myosin-binding protein [Melia azedarach]
MAEGNMNLGMSEAEVKELKDALCAQQQLLQKLYAELDVEREASATAVSEALSMILRLQEEKSAVVMEASQYKRMTEAKICHAEESLAAFEELMYQKEMEIAALEFQVQAYKCKLMSLGCNDVCVNENRYQESLLPRNDGSNGENGTNGHVRRLKSLPPLPPKDSNQNRGTLRRRRSLTPEPNMVVRVVDEEANDQNLKSSAQSEAGDLDSYWDQIRKLDVRVKEITDRSANLKDSRTSSLRSQLSTGSLFDQRKNTLITKLEQLKDSKLPMDKEAFTESACSSSVYDVFEVPQHGENGKSCSKEEKGQNRCVWGEENRLGKPDLFMEETSNAKIESDLVKKLMLSVNQEKGLTKARDGTSIECNPSLPCPEISINDLQPEIKRLSRSTERFEAERHNTRHEIFTERAEELNTSVAEYQPEFQELRQRIERLEADRNSSRHEIVAEGGEQLSLLKEIREQLNSIESQMRSWKPKKSPDVDSSIHCIQEAMLYFWL